jgi:hypothetical protein
MAEATAKLDLDVSGLNKGAQEAYNAFNRVIKADQQARAQFEKPRKDGGFGGFLESERKVKTQLSGLVRDLAGVRSASDAVAISAVRLGESFKVGFGAAVGFAIGEQINDALKEASERLNEFSEKWKDLLSFNSAGASSDQLAAQLGKAKAQAESATEKKASMSWAEQLLGFGAIYDQGADSAETERDQIAKLLAKRENTRVSRVQESLSGDSAQANRANVSDAFDQKIAGLASDSSLTPEARESLIDSARQEKSAQLREIDRQIAKKQKELKGAQRLLGLQEGHATPAQLAMDRINQARFSQDFFGNYDARANAGLELRRARYLFNEARLAEDTDSSGALLPSGTRFTRGRDLRRIRERQADSTAKLNRTGGLINVHRDSNGKIIDGLDPTTGQRRGLSPEEALMANEQAAKDAEKRTSEAGAAEKLRNSGDFWKNDKDAKAARAAKEAQDAARAKDASKSNPAGGGAEQRLQSIESILRSWDQ